MARDDLREEQVESEWEAAPIVGVVIGLQVALALVSRDQHWKMWDFGWWIWFLPVAPELLLLVLLTWHRPRRRLEQAGMRRMVSLSLVALISAANGFLVVAVIASLVTGQEKSGAQLLLKAAAVWSTNIVAFALWYWALDRGGPVRRTRANPPLPDFQFPQMDSPDLAPRGWQPHLFDYVYVSFTNSIAFSPTDTLPLTRRAKALMLWESAISALTLLLVAARAVNIFH
jgi:uncharacterized membrane protein